MPADLSPTDQARVALQQGDYPRADAIHAEAVRRAGTEGSPRAYTAALFEQAQLRALAGDFAGAATVLATAASVEPAGDDSEAKKDQLTYLRNQGEALLMAGDVDGAERVLRDGLARRLAFYGPEHDGYAFGLEPLADLVWRRGEPAEAAGLLREALGILGRRGNRQYASALARLALVMADLDEGDTTLGSPWGGPESQLGGVPDELVDDLVQHAVQHAGSAPPGIAYGALAALRTGVERRLGPDHPWMRTVLSAVAEAARRAVDSADDPETVPGYRAARLGALEALLARLARPDDDEVAIQTEQGLALAYDEAGRPEDAEAAYRRAIARARRVGPSVRLASVLRNFGLFLAERGHRDGAEPALVDSLAEARRSAEPEPIGRALAALGIFRQHGSQFNSARDLLDEALTFLPTGHPDAFSARSHLDAIASSRPCGCGDPVGAFTQVLRELVLPHIAPGLLAELTSDSEGNLDVKLAREPTPEEVETLNRVIQQARTEVRRRAEAARYS